MSPSSPSRRRLLCALAAAALPAVVAVWALWRGVYVLEAGGLRRTGEARAVAEWAALSLASAGIVAMFWAPSRPLRVLGYTVHSLVLSAAFGIAGVIGVFHGFGGPAGDLAAPTWALVALSLVAGLCVVSLLATAGLVVEDVRAGDAEAAGAARG